MKFHKVEVDDEIFQFVKSNAEPLVDTFNSALKRLLPISNRKTQNHGELPKDRGGGEEPSKDSGILPEIFNHTPQALRQTLEVVYLILGGTYTRIGATKHVAKKHKVAPQTIYDKYCRQLDLTAGKFDRLLREPGLGELRTILKEKFHRHSKIIDEICSR